MSRFDIDKEAKEYIKSKGSKIYFMNVSSCFS